MLLKEIDLSEKQNVENITKYNAFATVVLTYLFPHFHAILITYFPSYILNTFILKCIHLRIYVYNVELQGCRFAKISTSDWNVLKKNFYITKQNTNPSLNEL